MKKINLILCALALVGTAYFASCSNDSVAPTIDFVTSNTTKNYYSVGGTYITVAQDSTVDASGVAGTSDAKVTTKKQITKGFATITWNESKQWDGNISQAYTISFNGLKGYQVSQTYSGATLVSDYPSTNPDPTTQTLDTIYLYKIGEDFYYESDDGEYVKASAAELESGEDFTLSFSYSIVDDNAGVLASDSKVVDKTTTTYTYSLSFKAAQ